MERVDFEFIEPLELHSTIRGVDVKVSPLTVADLPRFSAALKGLPAVVGTLQRAFAETALQDAETTVIAVVVDMMAEHGNTLTEAVAIGSGQPVDWVRNLRLDELVALATMALRVNVDFFLRALPGMRQWIEATAETVLAAQQVGTSTGQTPSKS